jgi:hypothetical protein
LPQVIGAVLLSALCLMLQQHQSGALQSVQPGNQVTNGYVCAQAREQQIQTRQLAVQK